MLARKIGFKLKIWDFKYLSSFEDADKFQYWTSCLFGIENVKTGSKPTREPLLSDIHLLFYGSGILYTIINTKSEEEFKDPLIGTGIGFSFKNGLDFNISYGIPIISDQEFDAYGKLQFVNFGFDIQIGEYISRLKSL